MTDSTDVSDVKMTRFGNRVYLFRKRHVRVKDEAKIASRGTDKLNDKLCEVTCSWVATSDEDLYKAVFYRSDIWYVILLN